MILMLIVTKINIGTVVLPDKGQVNVWLSVMVRGLYQGCIIEKCIKFTQFCFKIIHINQCIII